MSEEYRDYEQAMQRFQKAELRLREAIREIEMAQAQRVQALTRWEQAVKEEAHHGQR